MAIRVTGMYSGLDTESIISELISAQSVKKSSLEKAQTKLSWKQDAWKALNTKIYDFYTNTLSNMRYESSYMMKTTKVSNTNAISVVTGDNAIDGVRSVMVNQLAKGANLTSGSIVKNGVYFTSAASLSQICKFSDLGEGANLSGSFRVVGTNGAYVDLAINENNTIDDVIALIQSTGLNANFDQDNQRIFISSKNTGAVNNFSIVANDEGGLNALACLGLLTANDLASDENKTWAAYQNADGTYTDEFAKLVDDEVARREAIVKETNDSLAELNEQLKETNDKLKDQNTDYLTGTYDSDALAADFRSKTGKTISTALNNLYGDNGLYDQYRAAQEAYNAVSGNDDDDQDKIDAKAALDAAKTAYNDAAAEISDYINDLCYGPLEKVQAKDEDGNLKFEADGVTPVYEQELDEKGDPKVDDDGNPVYVMARQGGLKEEYEEAEADGNVSAALQAKVDALNALNVAFMTLGENKSVISANESKIASNEATIKANEEYMNVPEDDVDQMADISALRQDIVAQYCAKVEAAQQSLDIADQIGTEGTTNVYASMATASKVNAQDAEILIDGAKFTSMTNTFSVNGLTLTALETTDKEVTLTTSTDTDGIYDMIKNFFTEYNNLINEMDSLYNAESSSGYEPLTSEEKAAMSDSEIEEWEKKIKDSLLRKDSTLSSVSYAMLSILLNGATVNGKQMYLSDFGISTLGYFNAAENERNAYHIDGDPDDSKTKGNEDVLKKMIASDPETVMSFFTQLSTKLYDSLTTQMGSTTLSSAFTVYNDKQMKTEYNDYADRIAKEEEKLNNMMDKWYSKFSAMEVALSKLESQSSYLTGLLGG